MAGCPPSFRAVSQTKKHPGGRGKSKENHRGYLLLIVGLSIRDYPFRFIRRSGRSSLQ